MKKPTLNFGEFLQYDKVFITAESGIKPEKVTSVAFDGEVLYIELCQAAVNGDSIALVNGIN